MRRLETSLYGLAFALTGVGTALLGSTLPATLHQWNLADSRGGVLLLAAWGGSTGGALLARQRVDRSAALGLLLSAAALSGMSLGSGAVLGLLYLLYGVGLGTTMTSISLLHSRGASTSAARAALNRLNLLWALGACFAPALALHSLRLLSISVLFRFAGGVFAVTAVLLLALAARSQTTAVFGPLPARPSTEDARLPWAPLSLGLFAAASVGLESAVGSWLTTYTERSTLAVNSAVSANAAFWVGLLLSRGVHSLPRLPWVHTRQVRLMHLGAIGVAHGLFFLHPTRHTLCLAGLLCGWGLGPLYPLVLSVALPRYRSTAVFVLAGLGASLVPWVTGLLSSAFGSLRLGLLAPTSAFGLLLVASIGMQAELRAAPPPQS